MAIVRPIYRVVFDRIARKKLQLFFNDRYGLVRARAGTIPLPTPKFQYDLVALFSSL